MGTAKKVEGREREEGKAKLGRKKGPIHDDRIGSGILRRTGLYMDLVVFSFSPVFIFFSFVYIYKREEEKKREEKKSGGRNEMGGGYDRGKAEGVEREDDSPRLCYYIYYITLLTT